MGWLLELGSQRDLGAHRLAQLRGMASHAPDERASWGCVSVVGIVRLGGHDIRFSGREHVFVRFAQLRYALTHWVNPHCV